MSLVPTAGATYRGAGPGEPTALDRVVEVVLTAGLLGSAALLLAGLVGSRPRLLSLGVLVLLLTPMARVLVVTVGLFHRRDWVFAAVSLWILGVLAFSLYGAFVVEARRARPGAPPATQRAGQATP